ncbi:uncharacterized protein [Nicotiana tomentosiformis]|uniref:uncharacterized protein n=1 Tax=Nicotiana tomentosiformis TaxID=4098 RepID=UPI00388CCCE5
MGFQEPRPDQGCHFEALEWRGRNQVSGSEAVERQERKSVSQPEDPEPKPRRVRRKVIAFTMDSVQKLRDEEEEDKENVSALTVRPRKAVEVTKLSEPTATVKIKPHIEEASKNKSGEDPESSKVEIVSQPSATTPGRAGSDAPKIDQSIPSDLFETMTVGHLPSLLTFCEEALREARELKSPDIGRGSSVGDPFRDCFTEVDDASNISDASIPLEEAQRLLSRAFAKFRADLSQCETELKMVSEERNALKLLCGQKDETIKDLQANLSKAREEEVELDKQVIILLIEYGLDPTMEANISLSQLQQKVERIELLQGEVDQVKADCDRWKKNMDCLATKKETTLAKLSSAEVQLRGIKKKSSAQAKRIEELEIGLAEAEIEKTKVMADMSISMYRANFEAAQMQLRESSD